MRLDKAVALAAAMSVAGCAAPSPRAPPSAQALRALEAVHLDPAAAAAMLNAYRASHGLGPVRLDPALLTLAQRQADAMVAGDALSHDVAGSFFTRIEAAGVDTTRAAENIGGGYYSTEEAFAGWRASAEHDANLLMPQATRFGIALAKEARTQLRAYWAMEVAADPDRPAALATAHP